MKKKKAKKATPRIFEELGAAASGKAFPLSPANLKAPPHFAEVTAGVISALKNAPPPERRNRTRSKSLVLRVLDGCFEDVRNAAETLRVTQAEIVEKAVEEYVGRIRKERRERGEEWVKAPPPRRTRNA